MKKSKKIKEGLAILLCTCMVSGTMPLPARAESFTDGLASETENTNGDESSQTPASVEQETNAESNSELQTPAASESQTPAASEPQTLAASEPQTNAEKNAPSQEPVPVETEGESEADFSSQDPVVIEPETAPSSQDPVEEVQKLIHALPDAKGITQENLEEVMSQLDDIDERKAALTEEQTARLDFTRYDEAAAAVMALMGMEGANEIAPLIIYDTKTAFYIDENGNQTSRTAEIVTGQSYQNQTVKWGENSSSDRYYVVEGNVSIDGLIEVTGTAHLILADGATLNAKRGIKVSSGNNLYICAQSGNTGKLIADSAYGVAIGGVQTGSSVGTDNMNQPNAGNIYIFGGSITATTAIDGAAAIGGAKGGSGGSITICGGTVTATSKSGDGIGGGASFCTDYNGRKGNAVINTNSITGGNSSNWNGIVYINKEITIYGNSALIKDFTVPKGYTLAAPNGSATLTINQGVTMTLEGTLKDGISIINNGTLINNSSFTENGTFTNNGTFQNNGDAVFNGKVSNTEKATMIINNLSLEGYSTLTIGENAVFDNQGTIDLKIDRSVMVNNGTFTNSGEISGDGPLNNNGTAANNGTWKNSKITNSAKATFTNNADHTVFVQVFDNQGEIVNYGSFESKTIYEAKITNSGNLQNNNSINVKDIENTGTTTNAQGATCTVNDTLTNSGTFTNNGTVTVSKMSYNAGKLVNSSIWTANYNMYNGKTYWEDVETYANAVIENYGTITADSNTSTFENCAIIKNHGSINVSGKLSMKEGASLSGNAIHMAERSVTYIQADGSTKTEKIEYDSPVDNTLNSGNYLLNGTFSSLTVNGDTTLILTEDSTITGSITVNEGATLNIYTASDSTHTMQAANIGGSGKVIVNSGKVTVSDSISEITVNNGEVTADSIGTVKISRGIINANTVDKAEGISDNSGVIFADTIKNTDDFRGIAFIGNTGKLYGTATLTLGTSFTVPQGKTLIIEATKSLLIPRKIVLTYAGTIEIQENGILYRTEDSCLQQQGNGKIKGKIATEISESLITYVLPDGTSHEAFAKPVEEETTKLTAPEGASEAWYVILKDVALTSRLEIKGNINLILTDGGCTLDAKSGIYVPVGSSLTIYGQSGKTGTVKANGYGDEAGIGGNDGSYGNITINGGIIEAVGNLYGAGIGGGKTTAADAKVGKIVINGGKVTAKGGKYSAGIGGGRHGRGEVEINGGIINAAGGKSSAGIGGGYYVSKYKDGGYSCKSIIKINGGEVHAKAGEDAAGIGSGSYGGADITITGGKVYAEDHGNSGYSTAIGSGKDPEEDIAIRITGGEVTVKSGYKGIGNSGRTKGNAVVAIEGGTVNVTSEKNSSICASGENGGSVTISGGQVTVRATQNDCINASSILISGGVVDATNSFSNIWYGTIGYYTNDVTISGGIVKARNQSSGAAIRAKNLTLNGNAVIYASNDGTDPVLDVTTKDFSSGIFFEDADGSVYGTPMPDRNWEIPADSTFTIANGQDIIIPAGVTLTNNGSIGIEKGGQLYLRGTLDTTKGTVTNKGTIRVVNGTINGEDNISSTDGGSLIEKLFLTVTVGTNGNVTYGTDYKISYKLEDGTEAPQAKADSYSEQYASKAGTPLQGKPTDIGDYTVTVSYQTEDGTTCEGSAEFSVIKAAPTLTKHPEAEILTYNKAEQALIKAGATNDGTIQYKLGTDGKWSEEVPTAKNAGDYVVYYQIIGNDTHDNMEPRQVNARIEKKKITVIITPNGGTYEGTITPAEAVLEGTIDGENQEVTLTYTGTANDGTKIDGTEPPTKAGTYTVAATLSDPNTNYELTGTTKAEFTVARTSAELAVGKVKEKRQGDEDFQLEVTRKGDGALKYESSDVNVLTVSETGIVSITGHGTATITVSLEESANYLADTAKVEVIVKMAQDHGPHSFENGFCRDCGTYQPAGQREDATYEIGNAGQLYWFAGLVNGDKEVCTGDVTQDLSAKAVLTADITVNTGVLNADGTLQADTENLRSWTPVGSNTGTEENAAKGYSGTFDGQNHTVSGLYFNDANADEVGLFGYTTENFRVSNVGITDSYFAAHDYVGAVCGKNDGIIRNCYNTGTVSGNKWVSGVGGYNNRYNARVVNCYNIGTICAKQVHYADGVAYKGEGETWNNYYLAGCAAEGTIFTDHSQNESKTAEQFTGGEVAYLLSQGYTYQWNDQDCESYDGSAWGQDLSREASWPVLDVTKKVYCGYKDCSGKTYANEPLSETPNHKEFDANGFCTVCGGYQPAVKNAKGIYEIGNVGQLYWFAGLVNGTLGYIDQDRLADAVLTKDITVNSNVLNPDGTLAGNADSLRSWTPIGSDYNNQYTGTFDGQNHTISGLYLDNPDKASVGLFGSIGSDYNNGNNKCARISNVNLVDSYFNAGSNVGGVCGQSAYLTSIENCRNAGTVKGDSYVGGICGDNSGTIQTCINTGVVSGTGSSIGGIGGGIGYSAIIVNCYNTGAVNGIYNYVGGVCGSMDNGTIVNSYNTGVVSGSESDGYSSIGGVCGQYSNGKIVNCYYLAGCAAEGTTFNNTDGERTKEQFASGEIAYLLDKEYTDIMYWITYDGAVWGQKLGKGGDNYPVFSENKVYRNETYKGCSGNPGEPDVVYSNTKADPVYAEHTDTDNDGKCDSCGKQYTVVTVSCNPSNSGILDGGGKYELGDQIILNARAVDGFVFVGWYNKEQITESDQPLSTETTYNYGTVDEQTPSEISLYAVYKSNETRQLSMTLGNGKVEYSYQNGTKTGTWGNDFTNNNYARGTYFTVTAKPNEGYTFLYWINSDGRVLTDSLTYSFYLGDNMKLQACYKSTQGSETETEKHYVIFKDSDGKILWSGDVSMDQAEGNDKYGLVNVPQHGIFNGVTFKNWRDASGNVLSTEETGSIKVTEDMIIYAEYEAISGLTLTVDGVQSDKTYTYGSLVTATAEESKDGKYFSGWYVGDKLVSDKREYSFRITENTAIEAKYDGEDVITQQPLLNMTMSERTTLSNGYQTVVMNVSWSVPEGYEFVDAGIVRTLTDAYKDKLTLSDVDNTNVKKNPTKLTTADGTMVYTLTLSTASVSKNVYAKGYMTYKNTSTGEVNTLYTDAYTSNAAK